jgi:hypothetical protein
MANDEERSRAHLERFYSAFGRALEVGGSVKLVLSKPARGAGDLQRVDARLVELKGARHLQLIEHHTTRDVAQNVPLEEAINTVRALVGATFLRAHLRTQYEELELMVGKRGTVGLVATRKEGAPAAAPIEQHDRVKRRRVDPRAQYLVGLGVTDTSGAVIPAMARKFKQIDKFVEVLEHALDEAGLLDTGRSEPERVRPLNIADFGCGKGYLTFAAHEHLSRTLGLDVRTVGVELRDELVLLCKNVARRCASPGLSFERGDVSTFVPPALDVMIALHACDTATDHALHLGLRAGARVLVCSPCCHKELRPQVTMPTVLAPLLRHGVHLGQEAEMLTDGLRALLVEAEGYDAKVFEFVALEHTSKNKMLVAVRRPGPPDPARRAARLAEVASLKAFYGVREQRLESLLVTEPAQSPPLSEPPAG